MFKSGPVGSQPALPNTVKKPRLKKKGSQYLNIIHPHGDSSQLTND